FDAPATLHIYTLSLHVALPISRRECRLPCPPAHGHGLRGCRTRLEPSAASGGDRRSWPDSAGAIRHSGHTGVEHGARAVCSTLRRTAAGETRGGDLWRGCAGFFLLR